MNIQLPSFTDANDKMTSRQVVLLTAEQNEKLLRFAKRRSVSISALMREVMMQVIDQAENP